MQAATVRYFEAGGQMLQHLLSRLLGLGEGAEGVARPVISVTGFGSAVSPVRGVSDAGDADEHVHVPHHLREDERRDLFESERSRGSTPSAKSGGVPAPASVSVVLPGVDVIEADLVCGQVEVGPRLCSVGSVVLTKAF